MSVRLVAAADWTSAKSAINGLLSSFNAVHIASTTGTITPSITLEAAITQISRSIAQGEQVDADEYSDGDGLVYKYNLLRKYESCRRQLNNGSWQYNRTVTSVDVIGTRSASFPPDTPDYIAPPNAADLIENIVSTRDVVEIIVDGVVIHNSTVLGVAPGAEYVYINECHSSCHSSCHGDCRRSKR